MLNRISYILLLGLLTISAFLYITFSRKQDLPPSRLTGVERCADCHAATRFGDQYGIWRESAHARAYSTLWSDTARSYIAAHRLSIDSCLSCHTTLGRRTAFAGDSLLLTEGVGCERCHGPGSNYADFNTMSNRSTFISRGGIRGTLRDCSQCHSPQADHGHAPCPFERAPFNADSAWNRIAHPAPTARRLWDTIFKGRS